MRKPRPRPRNNPFDFAKDTLRLGKLLGDSRFIQGEDMRQGMDIQQKVRKFPKPPPARGRKGDQRFI